MGSVGLKTDGSRMMLLLFTVGDDRFGLDVSQIVEVIPYISLKRVPRAPECVAGLFNFRGAAVPVIDLAVLIAGTPSQRHLSTRIVLVRYAPAKSGGRIIGLVLEHATETIKVDPASFVPAALGAEGGEFLGELVMEEKGMIQLVHVNKLLPEQLRALLFSAPLESDAPADDEQVHAHGEDESPPATEHAGPP